jgi:hypothetical protein
MNHGLWIPERIWALPLSLHERIFLAVIQSYADTGKDCFASNEFLAQRCDTSEVQIRKTIKKLLDLGYLSRDGYASSRKLFISELVQIGTCSILNSRSSNLNSEKFKSEPEEVQIRTHTIKTTKKSSLKDTRKNTRARGVVEEKKEEVVLPFDSSDFSNAWENWKEYRAKEFGFKYKSHVSQQTALHSLQKLSDNNERTAIGIIGQSIAAGWRGLFPLKGNGGVNLTREGFTRHFESRGAGGNPPAWTERFTGEI